MIKCMIQLWTNNVFQKYIFYSTGENFFLNPLFFPLFLLKNLRMRITFTLCFFIFFSLTGLSQTKVVAEKGDGIHSLLRRYDMDSAYYIKEFIKINKELIGENDWLTVGNEYLLPERLYDKKKIEEAEEEENFLMDDLFGKGNEKVMIVDNKLEGAIFYVVAGHGGPDPGAMGDRSGNDLCEDEYAYDVSLRLYRNLLSHGAKVYMVIQDSTDGLRDENFLKCDQDEYCMNSGSIPVNHLKRLKQRTREINKISKDISNDVYERVLIIHCDSRSTSQRIDVFFYYFSKSSKGKSLAKSILETFDEKYGIHQPGRGYQGTMTTRDGLYLIKNTRPPAVYIELGNIQNIRDQIRFIEENNRQALANWLTEGIMRNHDKMMKK
jgi:N-acetylmuramoyl-L-alanine amidase